jgi:large subunit ribosomal protein L22
MKAILRSVRIAPKKANLMAKMVRGMPVQEAIASLERTHKKAARLVEELLRSAVANAEHNEKQDASHLIIKSIIVNQGTAYHRGIPKARGQVRPIRKFLSHISVELGIADQEAPAKGKKAKAAAAAQEKKPKTAGKKASQKAKNTVQTEPSSSEPPSIS